MKLTKRQTQIVELLAQGFTAEEVAIQLQRAVPTVRRHLQLAHERVGARNTAHLVAIAISKGFIQALCICLIVTTVASHFDGMRNKSVRSRCKRREDITYVA